MFGKEEKVILRDEMNLREIMEMVTFLKDSGVKTFEGMGICVEFTPVMESQAQAVPQGHSDPTESDMVGPYMRSYDVLVGV